MLKTVRSAEMPLKRSAFGGAVLFSVLLAAPLLHAEVTAVSVKGQVYLKGTGSVVWGEISDNRIVNSGDEIRTAGGAKATLSFKDGSRVELGPKSTFMLEKTEDKEASMKLSVGWMKAVVSRVMARRFSVRTPTAVCSVRGTEFDLSVRDSGATAVSLFQGSLGVADGKGNEVTLKPGESVSVDQQGIGKVAASQTQEGKKAEDAADRKALKREVGLEMTKEEVQAAAALEQKNAVYQQGKAMVDVNGYRVRLEEYIIRPTPTQFKPPRSSPISSSLPNCRQASTRGLRMPPWSVPSTSRCPCRHLSFSATGTPSPWASFIAVCISATRHGTFLKRSPSSRTLPSPTPSARISRSSTISF
ncbi:MAG: FecR family protein [Elusimicrobiota bacterium]